MYSINHLVCICQLEMPSNSPVFIFHVMRHLWSMCLYMQNRNIHPACLIQEAKVLFHLWDSFTLKMEQCLILFIFFILIDDLNFKIPKKFLVCFLHSNSSKAQWEKQQRDLPNISCVTGFLWTHAFILFLIIFMFCNLVIYLTNSILAWL